MGSGVLKLVFFHLNFLNLFEFITVSDTIACKAWLLLDLEAFVYSDWGLSAGWLMVCGDELEASKDFVFEELLLLKLSSMFLS